jgi:WS/DGAT/MGAT family acyltransferase
MEFTYSERLSALDATFLQLESHNAHMHVGAIALFDAAPLRAKDGTIDTERIQRMVRVGLHRVPRYQQRLATVPLFGNRAWVDDDRFNLHYHVRHVGLPPPGTDRQLKRLAGSIMSQQLDRGKPLWELWVVEGLEGDRVALITKAHHCMIDGVGSVELTGALMTAQAEMEAQIDDPPRWIPRPAPTPVDLFWAELRRRAAEPVELLGATRQVLRAPLKSLNAAGRTIASVWEALATGLQPSSPTPLNSDIGPHRRFDWLEMDLAAVKEIKTRLDGTVNDVVLCIVSGALGRFLKARGMRPDRLDFRAMIPVNVRTESQRNDMGNQLVMLVTQLPLGERDPVRRLRRTSELMHRAKDSGQKRGVQTIEALSDLMFTTLFSSFARLAAASRPYNVVVTNVPGPQLPTYFLGAQMRAAYPVVPLFENQALGVALFSYDGKLFWGLNADWDAVPDLHDIVLGLQKEYDLLRSAAASTAVRVVSKADRRAAGVASG